MTEHTPGSWQAIATDRAIEFDGWWITACPSPNMETELATVMGGTPSAEANANLIAAAPDLLIELRIAAAVLEEAHKLLAAACIDGRPMKGTASLMAAHAERCHAVIAKAEPHD